MSPVSVDVFFSSHVQLHGPHRTGELNLTRVVVLPSKCNTGEGEEGRS